MHEIVDTETIDAAEEIFWPQMFKMLIRERVKPRLAEWLAQDHLFALLKNRMEIFPGEDGLETVVTKIAIAAENGSDKAFERMHGAFARGRPWPHIHEWHTGILGRVIFSKSIRQSLQQEIYQIYVHEHLYEHVYEDHYQDRFTTFEAFVTAVSQTALVGIINGAEGMYRRILRALFLELPLPLSRRRPKAIKAF